MSVAIYPDIDTLSQEAARYVVRVASESITTHGRFTLALAGGSTPKKLYGLLASEPYRDQIDWALTEIFWSDERCVPPDSEESNYHLAQEVLLSKVPISAGRYTVCLPMRRIATGITHVYTGNTAHLWHQWYSQF